MTRITRRSALQWTSAAVLAAGSAGRVRLALGDVPRVLAAGELPKDKRLGDLKDLNGYFPFTPSRSVREWEQRAEEVRRQVLVACGLWPMPARPRVEATIHGKVDRDEYTVEKVYFESHPGLYVTGSLYRPKGVTGKRPTVITPHGHWANARFYDHGEAKIRKELESGSEVFEKGGRTFLQAICVGLVRMGYNAFFYDMLGSADNTMLPASLVHGFAKQRPEMSQPDHWGLFSAQSELRCLNVLGLQTWNSIRVLDWLTTLPDVDAERIGVTGASGGGTQTFLLGVVDERPKALFPAVMVSTAMQGGCTCENASYLRVNTGNIELAAAIAPRHLGMTAANDWTRELEQKGLPELRRHFELLGVPDRVQGKYFPFEHNYNHPSRLMMFAFMRQALEGKPEPVEERDYEPLTQAETSVWDAEHPQPAGGDEAELRICREFAKEFDVQLTALTPKDEPSLKEYRKVIGGGWDVLIGRDLRKTGAATAEHGASIDKSGYREMLLRIRNTTHEEECPAVLLLPEGWNRRLVIWLTDDGKSGLFDAAGNPVPGVSKLVQNGTAVVGVDLLYQGEFLPDGKPLTQSRSVKNPREFLGYTVGYNHPLFAQRVHDVLSVIVAARSHESPPDSISIVGLGKAGAIAAAAAVQAGDAVRKLAVHTGAFQFGTITEIRDPWLLPGAVRYGDVDGLLALRAPQPLWLGESGRPLTTAAFRIGNANAFTAANVLLEQAGVAAAAWLNS